MTPRTAGSPPGMELAAALEDARRVLVLGYGNPGRLDDGLGPALARRVEEAAVPGVEVRTAYQLVVEHALAVAEHDVVIFADAGVGCREPFHLQPVEPRAHGADFTTHSLSPGRLLGLARRHFRGRAVGYSLAVRGYRFGDFGEALSLEARQNLEAAASFLLGLLESRAHPPPLTFDTWKAAP